MLSPASFTYHFILISLPFEWGYEKPAKGTLKISLSSSQSISISAKTVSFREILRDKGNHLKRSEDCEVKIDHRNDHHFCLRQHARQQKSSTPTLASILPHTHPQWHFRNNTKLEKADWILEIQVLLKSHLSLQHCNKREKHLLFPLYSVKTDWV